MFKFKNVIGLVLCAAILSGSAAGCSSSASTTTAKDAEGTTAVEATATKAADSTTASTGAKGSGSAEFWFDKGSDQAIVDSLADAWESDSGVDVKITNYPDTAAYQTAIQQSIDQPTAPGLFTWWSGPQLATLAQNGKIADLTAEWQYYIDAGVSADIKDAFTVDGKVYAAPYSILYNTCLYNKTVFENAGITTMPTTFDEFLADCEAIKATGVTPIGLKNDSWASFIWFEAIVAAYDPQLYKDVCSGAKEYTDPEMKTILEVWQSMFDKGYFGEPVIYSDLYKDFATGKCAIMLEASPTASYMVKNYGMEAGKTIDAFVLPSEIATDMSVIFFEAAPMCVSENSKDKESALAALRNFYMPATQTVMVVDNGIANTAGVPIDDATIQNIITMSSDSSKYQLILRYYENTPSEIRDVALAALSKFMDGAASADETLSTIQAKADEIFVK